MKGWVWIGIGLALAAAIFLPRLAGAAPPITSQPAFALGERVRLKADTATTGTIRGVFPSPDGAWVYLVQWDAGHTSYGLGEAFLEPSIGPQQAG